jgi:hypothetical protein
LGYGRKSQDHHFQGDNTIFNDAASVLKWVKNKVSLGATKTVMEWKSQSFSSAGA